MLINFKQFYVFWQGYTYYGFDTKEEAERFAKYWGAIYFQDLP